MNKEDLLNLISDTDEKAFEQFIGANDNKKSQKIYYARGRSCSGGKGEEN